MYIPNIFYVFQNYLSDNKKNQILLCIEECLQIRKLLHLTMFRHIL